MRWFRIFPLAITVGLLWLLHHPMGKLPALAKIIDPVNGALAAAEDVQENFNKNLKLIGIQAPVQIWMEERLVPHIQAQNDHDLYFAQGYIHAYFRLWQMDIQTRAAGGRVSEVAGEKAINFDRGQRRKGMVFGAERSLAAMEAEPRTKAMLDAYRDGINAFIHSLNYRQLPLEYKLMGFYPEDWTNLRTALLMKYMADDLTGRTDDIAYTQLRDQLGQDQFDFLFPERKQGNIPVVPQGTRYEPASLQAPPAPSDSVWAHFPQNTETVTANKSETTPKFMEMYAPADAATGIGSNNWALSGSKTQSGKPILCNDPHLGLNLPSLWFEMQLSAPGINTYGASLPGAPGIVIGFNDNISWGLTNNYRDVKDFFEIKQLDEHHYQFNGSAKNFELKIETIKVKGRKDLLDTVRYTLHGPVMYDASFPDETHSNKQLACTWMGHRGSNELLAVYLLNRARDYAQFVRAIQNFQCPAQNFAYADVAGNIAIWGQGQFINKWRGQGKYVMEGIDSQTLWGPDIPRSENPHAFNPAQGYVASANQQVTDSSYPYWYNGSFTEWRSWEINEKILGSNSPQTQQNTGIAARKMTITDMMTIQNNNDSKLADEVLNVIDTINKNALKNWLGSWSGTMQALDKNPTDFHIFWSMLYRDIWQDEFPQAQHKWPSTERTVQLLQQVPKSDYFDDKNTSQKEGLSDLVQRALLEAGDSLKKLKAENKSEWYLFKNTSLTHLAKLGPFSYEHLKIGGWGNTINAASGNHGPSWRMIVEMDTHPKGYGVYPGGQSGNPGSQHYSDYINYWVEGKYFELNFLPQGTSKNPFRYAWTMETGK
ncbi:MAG: penicillin acylase family protein [Bacteroidetes bacterium]|nr:penicillin acylase family protein [Bacteroidota bacterium]